MIRYRIDKPADLKTIRVMRDQQLGKCRSLGLPQETSWDVVAITDEISSNILEHSDATWLEWVMEVEDAARSVRLTFRDNGRAFDLTSSPGRPKPTESQRGMGLVMVKNLADKMVYRRREDETNELVITRRFSGTSGPGD